MAADLKPTRPPPVVGKKAQLLSHPDATGESVWNIAVDVELTLGVSLVCRYLLHGDMANVVVPGARAGRRADGLWRHTCFEAFVAADDTAGYYEFNFSPSLDWAAYRFDYYRAGMTAAPLAQAPGLHARRNAGLLELSATVHFAGLPALSGARVLRVALTAVVEETDGRLSYWALQHPLGNPDFHHPDGLAMELSAP
jgi:hypothetical protein